ncbi:hypothetical protein [Cupriavidus pauculus]|uniref:hypothetical protein n=1 Tax=Cupriavidus pauculus TaxID=82633 RepID=UPI0038577BB8
MANPQLDSPIVKITFTEQAIVASWLCLATAAAITSRSAGAGINIVIVGTLLTAPHFALRSAKSQRPAVRLASKLVLGVVAAIFLAATLLGTERMVWLHADSYPDWLVTQVYHSPADLPTRDSHSACDKSSLLELRDMPDGTTLGRCGTFYTDGPVVRFLFNPFGSVK